MRSKILISFVLVLLITISFCGCNDRTTNIDNTQENENQNQQNDNEDNGDDTKTLNLEVGEGIKLTDGGKISVITVKTKVDYISVSSSGYVYSYLPDNEDYGYLWIYLEYSNEGNDKIDTLSKYYFKVMVSGIEMEEDTPTYSVPDLYQSKELYPNSKSEGWIVYTIPKNSNEVKFILELSNSMVVWNIDKSMINFQDRDLDNLNDGEAITFGSDEDYYEMSVSHQKTANSYSYKSSYSDYIYTDEASSGYKFVFIEVNAENKGSNEIDVPCPYDMKLIAGGKQYSKTTYLGENSYQDNCGKIYSGIIAEGIVIFEIPSTVSDVQIVVELTDDYDAIWRLDI